MHCRRRDGGSNNNYEEKKKSISVRVASLGTPADTDEQEIRLMAIGHAKPNFFLSSTTYVVGFANKAVFYMWHARLRGQQQR